MLTLDTSAIADITVNAYTAEPYFESVAFVVEDGVVKVAEYIPAGETYSYILLDKAAKDEIYDMVVPTRGKLEVSLNTGNYTYVSLANTKSLCTSSLKTSNSTLCDQSNSLTSVFGSNIVFKYEEDWQYWDTTEIINSTYGINMLSAVSPTDGVIVKGTSTNKIYIPYDDDAEQLNDYVGMSSGQWYLISNNKKQTITEIENTIDSTFGVDVKNIEYLLMYKNNLYWDIYSPINSITTTRPQLTPASIIPRHQSYWILLKDGSGA